jgi:hypothetical protein
MGNLGEYSSSPTRRVRPRLAAAVLTAAVLVTGAACTRPGGGTPPSTTQPPAPTTAPPGGSSTTTTRPPGGGGAGPAVGWAPPAQYVQPLAEVWSYTTGRQRQWQTFRDFEWDKILNGRGTLDYCVRWESNATVTAAQRDRVHVVLEQQYNKWMAAMTENGQGWNGWPYPQVRINVVGWAARNRNLLQWTDGTPVYTGTVLEGAPACPQSSGYTISLWLTAGMAGGTGGNWGQRVGSEYFMGALGQEDIHIFLHEVGHGFGLEDFYDWKPAGVGGFVMNAGSATRITEFDKWMLRDWWRHLKPIRGL